MVRNRDEGWRLAHGLAGAGQTSVFRRLSSVVLALLTLVTGAAHPFPQSPYPTDFSGWHLPLPAGEWVVSRGPCGSESGFDHQCGYYEDECALDLTSASGSMENVPVLAPQAGQVFFMGTRTDSGLALLLRHADGRVSALMHLARIVVAPDQRVRQGQVVAYAGNTGSSGRAHLHFHVQPNTVERSCLPLVGLDEVDLLHATATSRNLAWSRLVLTDPPPDLPAWLPLNAAATAETVLPARVVLPPASRQEVPVAVPTARLRTAAVYYASRRLLPVAENRTHSVFMVPLAAPRSAGDYDRYVQLRPTTSTAVLERIRLSLTVSAPAETSAGRDIVYISPTFVGPSNYSEQASPPRLCWSTPSAAGLAPLHFRAMIVGPQSAESGWITATCWQAPSLAPGTYTWKVFVRDGNGFMNRTNQRPYVFRMR